MNSIVRFFALSLFVALAISAATGTFNSYTTNNASGAAAAVYTNGFTVLIASAGWLYGDAMTLTTTASNTWATLVSFNGVTGIGLVGASCASPVATTSSTNLIGTANSPCPADFATVYTSTPSSPSSSTTGGLAPGANTALTAGATVKYTLTAPATTTGNVIGISVTVGSGTLVAASTPTTASSSSGSAAQYAVATLNYAFYVQTANNAQVCFQNDAQHTANPGNCGTIVTTTKSANIFSAAITGFVAMIALIFFN